MLDRRRVEGRCIEHPNRNACSSAGLSDYAKLKFAAKKSFLMTNDNRLTEEWVIRVTDSHLTRLMTGSMIALFLRR